MHSTLVPFAEGGRAGLISQAANAVVGINVKPANPIVCRITLIIEILLTRF